MVVSVFALTSKYETEIHNYFTSDDIGLPEKININLEKSMDLRYGENPHQKAAFYIESNKLPNWTQHHGKELSYNNFTDMESAYLITQEFDSPACSIIKHANPCGFGIDRNLKNAYLRAVSADPISYFGGIIGFNKMVDEEVANELIKPFLECIIAPSFSPKAMKVLQNKKNLRLISVNDDNNGITSIRSVSGGYLLQDKDFNSFDFNDLTIVTNKKPTENDMGAMTLGWKLVRYVKSNAIVFSDKNQLLSVGAGQMSRIDSVKIAIKKVTDNGLNLHGSIMASDAFFPFSDCVELAAEVGVSSIIQPGGSIKDEEIIKTANKLGIAMGFTGFRHFFH
jgi:phosphoribosylaminoimidazolecarboxamide formyltransferase/IMP cyclohydrolase